MNVRKTAVAVAMGVLLAGCADASDKDLAQPREDLTRVEAEVIAVEPDSVRIIRNVDDHPTLVLVCYEDIAWITVSSTYSGEHLFRANDYDSVCLEDAAAGGEG